MTGAGSPRTKKSPRLDECKTFRATPKLSPERGLHSRGGGEAQARATIMFSILGELDALDEAQQSATDQYADASDPRNDAKYLSRCSSHAILVMDTSASMRAKDATSAMHTDDDVHISRIDALLHAFQQGFVAQQLATGTSDFDFLSVIRLAEDAEFIVEMEPMESALNRMPKTVHPKQQGNYIPALQRVEQVVSTLEEYRKAHAELSVPDMCTHVLFMSDGKPSDAIRTRMGTLTRATTLVTRAVCEIVGSIWRRLGCDAKRLKFHAVGLGGDDFDVLNAMVDFLPKGVGSFHNARLSGAELLETFTTFSTTVTSTRQTSTDGGPRVLRAVTAEGSSGAGFVQYDVYETNLWKVPDAWQDEVKKGQFSKKIGRIVNVGERAIAVAADKFGEGGERNVFRMFVGKMVKDLSSVRGFGRSVSVDGFVPTGEEVTFHGLHTRPELNQKQTKVKGLQVGSDRIVVSDPSSDGGRTIAVRPENLMTRSAIEWLPERYVAKEFRKFESTLEKEAEFLERSVLTQMTASALADEFNDRVRNLRLTTKLPSVHFANCFYMNARITGADSAEADGSNAQQRFFFVEQLLDGEYRKWNTNFGTVSRKPTVGALGALAEEEEEDEDEDEGSPVRFGSPFKPVRPPSVDDLPQAFSHWTNTKRMQGVVGALLVCDLQGCYSNSTSRFNWVDPVIHSNLGKKGRFGRTDRGEPGMKDFLRTHKCNALCRALGLPHNHQYEPQAASPSKEDSQASSRNTSQYTINATDHLQERKDERDITTRELQKAKKHGAKTEQENGKLLHDFNGVRYVEAPGKVGVTGIRDPRFGAGLEPTPRGASLRGETIQPAILRDNGSKKVGARAAAPTAAAPSAADSDYLSPSAPLAKKSLRGGAAERARADEEAHNQRVALAAEEASRRSKPSSSAGDRPCVSFGSVAEGTSQATTKARSRPGGARAEPSQKVATLRQLLPARSDQELEDALERHNGHVGLAFRELKGYTSQDSTRAREMTREIATERLFNFGGAPPPSQPPFPPFTFGGSAPLPGQPPSTSSGYAPPLPGQSRFDGGRPPNQPLPGQPPSTFGGYAPRPSQPSGGYAPRPSQPSSVYAPRPSQPSSGYAPRPSQPPSTFGGYAPPPSQPPFNFGGGASRTEQATTVYEQVTLTLPTSARPGQRMSFSHKGCNHTFTVPMDAAAGATVYISVPVG